MTTLELSDNLSLSFRGLVTELFVTGFSGAVLKSKMIWRRTFIKGEIEPAPNMNFYWSFSCWIRIVKCRFRTRHICLKTRADMKSRYGRYALKTLGRYEKQIWQIWLKTLSRYEKTTWQIWPKTLSRYEQQIWQTWLRPLSEQIWQIWQI